MCSMVIDFHTHLGKGDPWYMSSDLEELKNNLKASDLVYEMKTNRVDRCIVNPPYKIPSKLITANFELSEAIKHHKDKFIGFAWLDPRIEDSCKVLEILVTQHGFRGLKLHPVLNGYYPSNKVVLPLINTAAKLSIPVYIHTGFGHLGKVEYLDNIIDNCPETQIVIGHMAEEGCIDVAKKSKNVFIETSFTTYEENLQEGIDKVEKAVRILGAGKLLYGSDWPWGGGMEYEITKIRRANITEKERNQILGENALKILSLDK